MQRHGQPARFALVALAGQPYGHLTPPHIRHGFSSGAGARKLAAVMNGNSFSRKRARCQTRIMPLLPTRQLTAAARMALCSAAGRSHTPSLQAWPAQPFAPGACPRRRIRIPQVERDALVRRLHVAHLPALEPARVTAAVRMRDHVDFLVHVRHVIESVGSACFFWTMT